MKRKIIGMVIMVILCCVLLSPVAIGAFGNVIIRANLQGCTDVVAMESLPQFSVRFIDPLVNLDYNSIVQKLNEPANGYSTELVGVIAGEAFLRVTNLTPGTYQVIVANERSLINLKKDVVITADGGVINMGTLLGGNADGDYRVFMVDYGILAKAYRTVPGDLKWDARADFNYDGKVYSEDFSILQVNFAKLSPILVGN